MEGTGPLERVHIEGVRDADMPHFQVDQSEQRFSVLEVAASDSRANGQVKRRVCAAARSPHRLANRCRVDIRVDRDRHVQLLGERVIRLDQRIVGRDAGILEGQLADHLQPTGCVQRAQLFDGRERGIAEADRRNDPVRSAAVEVRDPLGGPAGDGEDVALAEDGEASVAELFIGGRRFQRARAIRRQREILQRGLDRLLRIAVEPMLVRRANRRSRRPHRIGRISVEMHIDDRRRRRGQLRRGQRKRCELHGHGAPPFSCRRRS